MKNSNSNGNHDFVSALKKKISRNLTDIESRDDLSADEKSNRIVTIFSATCAGAAVQPIPFADIFVLTSIQSYMAERLAAVRGVPMSKASVMEILTDLLKVIGLGMVAQQVALGLYKVGLPFFAGFTTIPLVYGLTYGIGKVLDCLFIARAKGIKLSPEEIKNIWANVKKEGMAKGKEYRKGMKGNGDKNTRNPRVRYLKNNFDEAVILACLVDLARKTGFKINEENNVILSALRRSAEDFRYSDVDEIGDILSSYDPNRIAGLVSNVKGIAHEMEFVKLENEDGDSIYASLYPDTNHPGYDVQLFDEASGEYWAVQLKATDDKSYVTQWIEQHPDGEIVVTEELADKMGIESSGIENAQVTTQVEDFVDKLIHHDDVETLSSYFPMLALASVAIVIWELWKRYKAGQISYSRFKLLAGMAAGKKAIKIGALALLFSIPVINVMVGAVMVAQLIYSTTELASGRLDKKITIPKKS